MYKIRFFFLQTLFLGTPIIYAWLYIPGISFDLSSVVQLVFPRLSWTWFESVKVTFFLLCTAWALMFHILGVLLEKKPLYLSRTFLISLWVFSIWTLGSLWTNYDVNMYFSSGNPEKRHGWYFYLALFFLFFLLKNLSSNEKKKLLYTSFVAFFVVLIYALFQKLWFDPLVSFYQTRLDTDRAFSSLGNPNYLAGFILIVLPLLRETLMVLKWKYKFLWESVLWIAGWIVIYWTGSYLAWAIFALYIFSIFLSSLFPQKKSLSILWASLVILILVSGILFWYEYGSDILEMQKMKWFIARWYLWNTGLSALFYDPLHFIFWYGPDGFLAVSEYFRHPLLSVYEDASYRIDRSHNIFIDFALHFGFPLLVTLIVPIFKQLSHISHAKKMSLLIFAAYFSFNIPVLIHFLIVLQILTYPHDQKYHHE